LAVEDEGSSGTDAMDRLGSFWINGNSEETADFAIFAE